MAVLNFIAGGVNEFDSNDTVTLGASHTYTTDELLRKTDLLGMTIGVAAGVTIRVRLTGFIDIKGSAGNFVFIDSDATDKATKDWEDLRFEGTSTSNTMLWVIVVNGNFGAIFLGHAPVAGKFQFNGGFNCGLTSPFLWMSSSGTAAVSDIFAIKCEAADKSGTATLTWSNIYIDKTRDITGALDGVVNSTTINNIAIRGFLGIDVAAAQTVTITELYRIGQDSITNDACGIAGTLNITDSDLRGGNIVINNTNIGKIVLTDTDIHDGAAPGNAGLQGNNVDAWDLDGVWLESTRGAAIGNVDTSTATPNSDSTPAQYTNAETVVNVPASKNKPRTFTNIVESALGVNTVTIASDTGIPSKVRILYGTVTGVYTMSVEWDAPDVFIPEIDYDLPAIFTDWAGDGKKYKETGHSNVLVNLKENTTYFYLLEAVDAHGLMYQDTTESGTFKTQSTADTTVPVFPGDTANLTVVDSGTDKDLTITVGNTPTDDVAIAGFRIFFLAGTGEPFTTGTTVEVIPQPSALVINVGVNDTAVAIGVRAVDTSGNLSENTDFVTATPTQASVIEFGQATLVRE